MIIFKRDLHLFVILLCSLLFGACKNFPENKWAYTNHEVVGTMPQKTDQIDVDIYIDATTSMQGFAVSPSSAYSQFLDQLEASALSAWKKADPKFYKFGQAIKLVTRTEFLSAKTDLAFYHEKGIFLKTYIDSVVRRTDTKRLSVLVTDLFQNEGDVNIMVDRLKEKCFANGIAAGIIGVKSDFNGKVFDVPGFPQGYNLISKERPFYAIVFGNQYNMELLFDALKAKPFVKENQFLIFSNYIIKSYQPTILKTKDSKFLTNKKAHIDINSFDFGMNKKGKDGRFNFTIDLVRNTRCADFSANEIEIIAFKKSVTDPKIITKDSIPTNEISIENVQRTGAKLTGVLVLNNSDNPGNYSYAVYLKANPLTGLKSPEWIKESSTDKPVPGTPSAAKTFNLEKLSSTLLVANASVSPSYIAKFYINIFKR